MVTTRLSTRGQVSLYANVATDLVVDLYGFYTPTSGAVAEGRTVAVTPTFTSVGVLAIIVLIRTFLSWSLQLEIDGRWPWQKPVSDDSAGPRTAQPS